MTNKIQITEKDNQILTKKDFYILNWTWGILMSLIGALVCGCILLYGVITKKNYKLKKCGWCYYIPIGKNWGGVELGMFFLCDDKESSATCWHEHGHSIQNCYWGLLMPFVISIPSCIRYWYREFKYYKKGLTPPNTYDSIWFEGEATLLGRKYRKHIQEGN